MSIGDLLTRWGDNKLVLTMASVAAGAVLGRLIPWLWRGVMLLFRFLAQQAGGRFANSAFRSQYLDWIVTEYSELKLTGIVAVENAKKPKLEQVFVSVAIDRNRSTNATEQAINEQLLSDVRRWRDVLSLLAVCKA